MPAVVISYDSPLSIAELVRHDVEANLTPRYLYKYRSGLPNESTESIFRNAELWYPSPATFNDPFDCSLQLDTNNTYQEIVDFIKRNNPNLTEFLIHKQAFEWHKNPALFYRVINAGAYDALNANGIGCFSAHDENLLMWAHYADKHQGICLKFDVLADPEAFAFILRVEYPKNYPSWNYLRGGEADTVTKMITHKSADWEYEREWRILKMSMPGAHSFAKAALIEVTFGCRASADSIAETKKLIDEAGMNHIVLKQARKSINRYGVDINLI